VSRRVALYARVSTLDQNPEMQVLALKEFAARRGFTIVGEYIDTVTGNVEKRRRNQTKAPAYELLMADARKGKFDCVIVWKFDRFARSLTALIDALQGFKDQGIDFISATQDVDTTTAMGRLFFHVVGAFAEFEREMIVERVNAGIANARAKGVHLGRKHIPDEAKVIEMHQAKASLSQISRATGRSRAGVRLVLLRANLYCPPVRTKP